MPRAILSVHDKTGLVDFARGLHDLGWTLIASGGTAKTLRDNAIAVTEVGDYTGSPEILGGRVKTLHPAVHGGLLARSTEADHNELLKLGWDYIDLVAVNLYPFEATIAKPGVTFEQVLDELRQQQAAGMAFLDVFYLCAVVSAVLLVFVLLMKRSVAEKGEHIAAE